MIIEIFTSIFVNLLITYFNSDREKLQLCNNNILLLKNEINELYHKISDLHSEIDILKSSVKMKDEEILAFINHNYIIDE